MPKMNLSASLLYCRCSSCSLSRFMFEPASTYCIQVGGGSRVPMCSNKFSINFLKNLTKACSPGILSSYIRILKKYKC